MLNFTPMPFPVNSLLQMPSSGAHRLSSVSSHDSGFVSQDANTHSKPPSPMPSDITSQVAVSAMIFRENVLGFFVAAKQSGIKQTCYLQRFLWQQNIRTGGHGNDTTFLSMQIYNNSLFLTTITLRLLYLN